MTGSDSWWPDMDGTVPADLAPVMLLTFRFEGEAFAFPVTRVQEILDPVEYTPVPNAPAFVPGVINVRGVVVPVVDIRHRLKMLQGSISEASRMIVFETDVNGARQKLAFRADSVEQVIEGPAGPVEKLPELGATWPRRFIAGAMRHGDELIILLDADELFAPAADTNTNTAEV